MRALDVFRMPTPVSVMGRSSSITNSFINGIIPSRFPSEEDLTEALKILQLTPDNLRCCYCGDKATEWDHLRPLISGQDPTGYISEIQNLVPACGKCNQSKGNMHWRSWMLGNAKLCPRVRCISDLESRVERLEQFEMWREPTKLNIREIVGDQLWDEYKANWGQLLDSMRKSQELSNHLKAALRQSVVGGVQNRRVAKPRHSPRIEFDATMSADERRLVIGRIREWATKTHLNVHRIIGIVVRAGGTIPLDQLVRETERITKSKNAYGAIASLLTSKANAYGRVFEDVEGTIRIHPDVEMEVRAHSWS
jgi:HNH endonuclease